MVEFSARAKKWVGTPQNLYLCAPCPIPIMGSDATNQFASTPTPSRRTSTTLLVGTKEGASHNFGSN